MNAMLLCAGLGTRFRPHTEHLAKPALPFFGIPLAGFGLFYLEKLPLKNLVVNTHHLPATVEAAVGCMTHKKKYKTSFLNESPNILGSGGGIKNAENLLRTDEPFVVINGDELIFSGTNNFLPDMIAEHLRRKALATFLTIDHPEAGRKYPALQVGADGVVEKISVKGSGPNLKHNCGVYIYSPKIFDYMPVQKRDFHIFRDCLEPAMARGETVVSYTADDLLWLDTSDEESYIESTAQIVELFEADGPCTQTLRQIFERHHQVYEILSLPKGKVFLGKEAKLGLQAEIEGFAVLCPRARFDQGILRDSVIGTGVHVQGTVSLTRQLFL